jgi:glycine/D-amino acid oxidase-like deaminating enzyme
MNLSYWERKTWLKDIDYAIIGSGIVGLNCALSLRKKFPNSKIVIYEKGVLPSGASTKNAGFACYGSLSEILDDLASHSEEEVVAIIKNRLQGLQLLRKTLGDRTIDYQENGGYEVFKLEDKVVFDECRHNMEYVNKLIYSVFKEDAFSVTENEFGYENICPNLIFSKFEGQIDTGKMMLGLLKKAAEENIYILNNMQVTSLSGVSDTPLIELNHSEAFSARNVFIATNGFAKQFLKEDVLPARAQVIITKPIDNLKIKGTFHLDKGYYYFRNIDNRILLGGGRNLDFKAEETTKLGLTDIVQDTLENLLTTTILPNTDFEIDGRWSGIMGVGKQKKPIVKRISPHVFCGVRLGGMGVAIGSSIGNDLANLVD